MRDMIHNVEGFKRLVEKISSRSLSRNRGHELVLPEEVEHWSLTTLREKLVKIGARIVRHGR